MGLFDRFKKSAAPGVPGPSPTTDLDTLVAQLSHPDWRSRRAAAERLGELGPRAESAVPALEEAISDENGEVCLAASDALSKIRKAMH